MNTFLTDSKSKQLHIDVVGKDISIDNTMLHMENFSLSESICSESQLMFGSCEASCVKFRVSNIVSPIKGEKIKITDTIIGLDNTETTYDIGTYKVYSDVPTADRSWRDITAYDALYDIINANVADWYNGLTFPMSLKDFRDSFFAYFSIQQKETDLANDDMVVEKTISSTELSGKDVITAICEINGVFGHINRKNVFEYIVLDTVDEIFPSNELYPANNLFPGAYGVPFDVAIENGRYISCTYEDFVCKQISKLQVRQEENDIGVIVGDDDGAQYVIQDNFLVYGKNTEDLRQIAEKTLSVISKAQYRPYTAEVKGNLLINVGDNIKIYTKNQTINSYVLQREFSGIQSLRDTITANGTEEQELKVNGVQSQINQLKGRTNVLTRTLEETRSEITRVDTELGLAISDTNKELMDFTQTVTEDIGNLQNQIDGNITTWFYSYVPTADNYPASEWTTDAEKNAHLGDLFYIVDNPESDGQAYRWALVDGVYKWVYVEDADVTKALADAAKAQDTADSKRRIFTTQPTPPYDVGDTWMVGENGDILTCISAKPFGGVYARSDWGKLNKYTDDSVALEVADNLENYYSTTVEMNSAITQSAEQIKSEVEATYSTKTDLDNLTVGGRNICKNSDFSNGLTYWTTAGLSNSEILDDPTYGNYLSFSSASSGDTGHRVYQSPFWTGLAFEPGKTYTISFYAKASVAGRQIRAGFVNSLNTYTLTTQWERYQQTISIPSSATSGSFTIYSVTANTAIDFTQVMIVEGEKSVGWNPAPEDIEQRFGNYSTTTEMNSAIEQTAEQINLTVSQKITETQEYADEAAQQAETNAKNDTTNRLKNYSTTKEMNSAIQQSADSITLSVSQDIEETKEYADEAASNAEDAANTATDSKLKSYSTTTQMNSAINQKANEITASVNAQISNINGQIVDMSAEITVNAQNISQKVSKGDVVSEINQSSDTITLSSNRLVVNSTDFKLTQDGKIIIDADNFKIDEAGNVSVKGSGDFDGSFRVDVPIEGLPEGESASMYIGIDEGAVTMGLKDQATQSGNPAELAMTYYGETHLVGGSIYIGATEGAYDYPLNLEGNTLLAGDLKVTGNLEVGIESTLNGDVRCQNSLYSTQIPQTGSRNDSNGMGQQGRLVSTDLNHFVCFEWITYMGSNWLNGFVDATSLGAVQFNQ
ncbi:MAG: carbohydrate binding domain-containing protein [Oscillospiraceae bacterium]